MRETARKLGYVLVALFGAIALTFTSAIAWAATTVLVVPGTGTKDPSTVPGYQENVVGYYVQPTGACGATDCVAKPVPYIAEFWPIPLPGWGGLEGAKWDDSVASGVASLNEQYAAADKDSPIVIFGYSQGGTVVTDVKKQLSENGGVPDNVSFVLIGNASRPNGGLFTRPSFLGHIPILDVTFGPGTPTNTGTPTRPINTTDVGFQYDGVTDFPKYPVNLLATVNALAGFSYVHGKMLAPKGSDEPSATPIGYTPDEVRAAVEAATANCSAETYCQVSGDTRFVTLPAKILPLMLPLLDLGTATGTTGFVVPLVDLVSPVARVLIETGYDRRDYGAANPFGLFPVIDPLRLGVDLIGAAVQGVEQASTGTGDASKFLAPKPTAPATTDADADRTGTTEPKVTEPSNPQTTQEQAPVLQLVKTAEPKAKSESDPAPITAPTGAVETTGTAATGTATTGTAAEKTTEKTAEASAPAPSATEKATAPTATEQKPETAEPAADEPVVATAAA
ncbi:PE-PPE domain-containing protein [Tsukamurella asaccharolytica]|uniref:PE-PPE domain-containing protein n=1 Tax=Tsukamurella asaccharolytica TaxID=2592067 RepID=A0A5C5RDJ4_9ACTN|nr:PE-PPE domain-containing protein [Tsukamurella asaccharolytica]TWS20742.1 PE-PPE domain-containing protein [Tsukamurella asaccharolytica]